jgi:hypothetical protein
MCAILRLYAAVRSLAFKKLPIALGAARIYVRSYQMQVSTADHALPDILKGVVALIRV